MQLCSSIFSMAKSLPHLSLLIAATVLFSPLCIISSSLFQSALALVYDLDQQTTLLILTLITIWAISIFSITQLIRNRKHKTLFFYQFVVFLCLFDFTLIGVSYSLLRRQNLLQEVLAKILTSLMMIYGAQRLKIRTQDSEQFSCKICLNPTMHQDCIILPCKHTFHQKCLWDWLYYKNCCPTCLKPHHS